MTPAKLTCPHAKYNSKMYIDCTKTGDLCAHQRWCDGKGWCVLTPQAERCKALQESPIQEGESNERKAKTAKKRRNKV